MLITLCYMYLWLRFQKCYSAVVRSVLVKLRGSGSCVAFCARSSSFTTDSVFLSLGNKIIYITEPQACDDLSKWTIIRPLSVRSPRPENVAFIIEATAGQRTGQSSQTESKKVLKWSDYCLPLACSPGQPYRAVAEASLDNFSALGVAFLEDRLHMENGLIPEKIVSVSLKESVLKELIDKQQLNVEEKPEPPLAEVSKDILFSASACKQNTGDFPQNQQGEKENITNHHHMDSHHLHLSSCHECLELENSTIQSVKYASVENIPDLPDDFTAEEEEREGCESFTDWKGHTNENSKPPNVLVFTSDCEKHYKHVHSLLSECIDTDRYAIYPLGVQQALDEPWLENTLLLVVVTKEILTPELQLRFLTYLGQGGRVLGLSCSLCPAGLKLINKDGKRDQICSLNFTKADSTELELSVLASGNVFVREPHDGSSGEVELWGEICDEDEEERDMVIVRVTHGRDGGEAVLCQVHLEMSPDSDHVLDSAGFAELKMSNAKRYEVLTEILTSLGLSCELTQVPPPSPIYLLATQLELKNTFVHWLQKHVDGKGMLGSPKARMRLAWGQEELGDPGDVELLTETSEFYSEHFSMATYRQHLQSKRLGHTLLYAEVTSSTMDILEGLMLHLPEDMGLIAVAARQTKGKGRGKNIWLSPLGCAMFTIHLQIAVNSRLGQRIPFLQHLAALAVVEAVRTLPGYEDIDLRLKWPNDIYYSNLMKLGGVLVTSTVMGSAFHILIGCGFNVSNSNPTICINDLVAQHNRERGSTLSPLCSAQLIACTITQLEQLISQFQLHGPEPVLPIYYKRWIHGGMKVRLWSEDGPEAEIVGLDDYGFLQVGTQDQGLVSVQPDGNSFDMLRNLVVTKHN